MLPITGSGTRTDPRRAKYGSSVIPKYTIIRYGREPVCLFRGNDVDASQHTAMTANNDVAAFPSDLDQIIPSNQESSIRNTLENVNIPGLWVTAGIHKYSTVLKRLWQLFKFAQFLEKETGTRIFTGATTLDTTLGSLSAARRTQLQDVMDTYGFDRSGFTVATTVRETLTNLSAQFNQLDIWSDLVM